jgi:hypothetical protein
VLTLLISVVTMLAVVGTGMTWAVREQRRRDRMEEGHARDH